MAQAQSTPQEVTLTAGVPAGTQLEPVTGSPYRVTKSGTVVENVDVQGAIWVQADNVVIRSSRVTFGGHHAIRIFPGADGTVIEDTTVDCTNAARTKGIVFGGYTARSVSVNGCLKPFVGVDGVTVEASTVDGEPFDTASGTPVAGRAWWCVGAYAHMCEPKTGPAWPPTTAAPRPATPTTTAAPRPATPTTTAAPRPATPTTTAAPRPATPAGVPSAATTGFNNCGKSVGQLRAMSGGVTLGDGDVLENFDLTGTVTVTGTDVTIRCGRIRASGMYGVTADSSGSYLIEDVQIVGTSTNPSSNSAAISPYGRWTARHVDVTHFRDGVKLGSNQTIENSWVHGLWMAPGSHSDGMQSVGGTNVTVRNNNIEGNWRGQTSAMILLSDNSQISNYTVTGNRLSGGGFTVYIGAKPGRPTPRNFTLTNNTFVQGSYTYGALNVRAQWPSADPGAVVSNNKFHTGGSVGMPADCSSCP